jgi:hypothetical protein
MRRTEARALLCLVLLAGAARGEETSEHDRIEALEQRVAELEAAEEEGAASVVDRWLPEWTERVRLGGSASVGYFHRGDLTPKDSSSFQVWDARFFVDAELARDVAIGDTPIVRNIGATFEWDLVRIGMLQNDVGELYVDFQGVADSPWLNAQVGRFQLPVGENYLRFSKGYRDNPFISNTVGGPWWWDEGVKLYGQEAEGRFGYVASVANNDTRFNVDDNNDPLGTLKLFADPWPWLHLSASGLVSGEIGRDNQGAPGGLWLGETWAMPIGAMSAVPIFIDGVPAPDGPLKLSRTWLAGGDVILRPLDGLRVWLGGGHYRIDAAGSGPYDRSLDYWIAEVVADGRLISRALDPLYLGLRASGLTTGDHSRGYLLDFRFADSLGFNMHSLNEYSAVLGVRIGRFVRLRGEYAFQDVDLVRGATPDISSQRGDEHWFAFDVGISF